jgi:hypothetical protein
MNTESRNTAERIRRRGALADDRGAITVMAIFVSLILVGALWFIAGVGDSIVYRERMQEAADSVAFTAATIQARGMNVIVLVNLLMAAVLAIRVAINMLKLLCMILGPLFSALGLIPGLEWMEPIGDALDGFGAFLTDLDAETTGPIDDSLQGLNKGWQAVRDGTPALAEAGGLEMEERYAPLIDTSGSLPAVGKSLPTDDGTLPIEDGTLNKLCDEAGNAIGGILAELMGGNPVLAKGLDGPLDALVNGDPTFFCQLPGLTAEPPDVKGSTCSNATTQTSSDADAGAQVKKACDGPTSGGPAGGGTALSGPGAAYTPAQIRQSTPWWNGIADAQLVSLLTTSSKGIDFVNHDPKLVAVASVERVPMPSPSVASGQTAAWAQAEFFYDAPGPWQDSQDDAMWNFYWRARFRLTRPKALPQAAGDLIDVAATSYDEATIANGAAGLSSVNVYTGPAKKGLTGALTDIDHSPTLP